MPPATKATAATASTAATAATPPLPAASGSTYSTASTAATAATALTYADIAEADEPLSNQPQQLKASASHKAAATPVDGRFVGYLVPAATIEVVGLLNVTAVVGATKLIQ